MVEGRGQGRGREWGRGKVEGEETEGRRKKQEGHFMRVMIAGKNSRNSPTGSHRSFPTSESWQRGVVTC